ncbi:MAG: hypothetical protein ACI8XO_004838, partial [Verrucomicrobiales bacterium]
MINPEAYVRDKKPGDGRVNFVANATAKELVLNFDVDNISLDGDDQTSPLIVEFQLDARGYGKRRKFGYVDAVRVKYRIDGTAERISALRQSVFGDWHSRELDNAGLTCSRYVLNNGGTRYSIKIPRSYLYLHE